MEFKKISSQHIWDKNALKFEITKNKTTHHIRTDIEKAAELKNETLINPTSTVIKLALQKYLQLFSFITKEGWR